MKKYEKPIVVVCEELAEDVYALSGSQCGKPTPKGVGWIAD